MRKRFFWHMQAGKAQIRLRMGEVWSGNSLSTNRIIGYYRMFEWRAKDRMILCACAGLSKYVRFAHVRRHLFAWRDPSFADAFTSGLTELEQVWLRARQQNWFCFCFCLIDYILKTITKKKKKKKTIVLMQTISITEPNLLCWTLKFDLSLVSTQCLWL